MGGIRRMSGTLAALLLAASQPARAATCYFSTMTNLMFGGYDPTSPHALCSVGSLAYVCTSVGPSDMVSIQLSYGYAGTFSPRTLVSGSNRLNYNVYTTASHTNVWGDGTAGTSQYGPVNPPNSTPVTVYFYGKIPAGQMGLSGGLYSDTIQVTIVF